MALSRRAVGQVEQGADPDQVAQVLGMTRTAVYAWLARYREGGGRRSGSPLPGRPPRLSGAQVARLYGLVVPRQLRFGFAQARLSPAAPVVPTGLLGGAEPGRVAVEACQARSVHLLTFALVSRLWLPSWLTYRNASNTLAPAGQVTVTCTSTAWPASTSLALLSTSNAGLLVRGSLPSPDTTGKIQPLQPGLGCQEGGHGRAGAAALR